jgi:hypothetical protein
MKDSPSTPAGQHTGEPGPGPVPGRVKMPESDMKGLIGKRFDGPIGEAEIGKPRKSPH